MNDIIKRLTYTTPYGLTDPTVIKDAITEINRLNAQIDELNNLIKSMMNNKEEQQ